MDLKLKITSIEMAASTSLEDEDAEVSPKQTTPSASPASDPEPRLVFRQHIYFAVHPDDRDHLDLETGEVFEAPRYARIRRKPEEDKSISAQLNVYEASKDSDLAHNRMQYFKRHNSDEGDYPSSIYFSVGLPPRDFQSLLTNIQRDVLPSTVQIELEPRFRLARESDPLSYGWEPDGTGMKWRNTEDNRRVKIEGISFQYEILSEAIDSDTGEPIVPAGTSTVEVVHQHAKELKDQLAQVSKQLNYLGWIIIAAAAVLIFLRP